MLLSEQDNLRKWIEMILIRPISPPLFKQLRSGCILCSLVIKLFKALGMKQEALAIVIHQHYPEKNITIFRKACLKLGVSESDLFVIADFKRKPHRVLQSLRALQACVSERSQIRGSNQNRLLEQVRNMESQEIVPSVASPDKPASPSWEHLLNHYKDQLEASIGTNHLQRPQDQRSESINELEYNAFQSLCNIRSKIYYGAGKWTLPPHLHGEIWMLLSGAYIEQKKQPQYYRSLLQQGTEDADVLKQIDADLARTISRKDLGNWTSTHTADLRAVLIAYSIHNPQLGYCQGLNYIVARMLQYLNASDSFWLLVKMIDSLPSDYFTTMYGVAVDQRVFSDLVNLTAPQICAHLQHFGGTGLELSLACTEWFLTLFSSPFCQDITIRLWDIFFAEGDEMLFKLALALIRMHTKEILNCSTYADVLTLLDQIGKQKINPDAVFPEAWAQPVDKNQIEDLRAHQRLFLAASFFMNEKRQYKHQMPCSVNVDDPSDSYAYYFNDSPPTVHENHWTAKLCAEEWDSTGNQVTISDLVDTAGASMSSRSQQVGKATPRYSHRSKHHSRTHLTWRKKLEEWHKDKKYTRHEKERQKKLLREQKRAQKVQKHIEKNQAKASEDVDATGADEVSVDELPVTAAVSSNVDPSKSSDGDDSTSTINSGMNTLSIQANSAMMRPKSFVPMSSSIRRQWSVPALHLLQDASTPKSESAQLLRERANIVSFLHRTSNEARSACSTPKAKSPAISFSADDTVSTFLGRLSASLENTVNRTMTEPSVVQGEDANGTG